MLSLTGFLTVVVSGSLLALAVWILLKNKSIFLAVGTSVPMILSVLIMVRLLIPFELGFEKSVYLDRWLPQFQKYFTKPFLHLGHLQISPLDFLCIVWLAGAVLHMAITIGAMLLHNYRVTEKTLPCQPEVRKVLNSLYDGRKSGVRFYLINSAFVKTPMLIGFFKPKIIVPNVRLTAKQWSYVLSHEMEHYDHHDLWIRLCCECICAVYWWNPLIHALRTKFYDMLEIHNDTVVTRNMSEEEKCEYADCLKLMSENNEKIKNHPMYAMPFSDACKTPLGQRILFLTKTEKRDRYMIPALVISLIIAILAFSFVLEPQYDPENCFSLTTENTFFVVDSVGNYDLYLDGKYYSKASTIPEDLKDITVYQSIDEVN